MARLEDIPELTRSAVRDIDCPSFDTTPSVSGPPLAERRVAIVSSAALIRRGDKPFQYGSGECRPVPSAWPAGEVLTSHVSINFDRAAFQRDRNVVFPLDRLNELAAEGVIGSVAETHYTMMGAIDPVELRQSAETIAASLHAQGCNAVLLSPV